MRAVDDINDKTTPGYKGIEPINHVIAFITLFINQGSDILNTVHAPINLLFKAPSQIYLLHQTKTKMITFVFPWLHHSTVTFTKAKFTNSNQFFLSFCVHNKDFSFLTRAVWLLHKLFIKEAES